MADIQSKLVGAVGSVLQTAMGAKGVTALQESVKGQAEQLKYAEEQAAAQEAFELKEERANYATSVTEEYDLGRENIFKEAQDIVNKARELKGTDKQVEAIEDIAYKTAQERVKKLRETLSQSIQYKYASGELSKPEFKEAFIEEKLHNIRNVGRESTFEDLEDLRHERKDKTASEMAYDFLKEEKE